MCELLKLKPKKHFHFLHATRAYFFGEFKEFLRIKLNLKIPKFKTFWKFLRILRIFENENP